MLSERSRWPFFKNIRIDAFRGFNDAVDVDLDASAIVLWGANGRGKTSLTDAIQWLLLGHIPRLHALRGKTSEEYIVNRYAEAGGKRASVRAVTTLVGGQEAVISRDGNRRGSVLEVRLDGETLTGDRAELRLCEMICSPSLTPKEIDRYMFSMALLQQDVVRAFIADDPGDSRYALLSRLLGLETLTRFVKDLDDSMKPLKERERAAAATVDGTRDRLERLRKDEEEWEARVSVLASYRSLGDEVRSLASGRGPLAGWARMHADLDQTDVDALLGELRAIDADTLLLRTWAERALTLRDERPPRQRAEIERTIALAEADEGRERQRVADAQDASAAARLAYERAQERAEMASRLAATALPLLEDVCPVCNQTINRAAVAARLTASLGTDDELERAAEARAAADLQLGSAQRSARDAEERRTAADQDLRAIMRWERTVEDHIAGRDAAIGRLAPLHISPPDSLGVAPDAPGADAQFVAAREALMEVGGAVHATLTSFQELASAGAIHLYRAELARARESIGATEDILRSQQGTLDGLRKDIDERKLLVASARTTTNTVVEETFGQIEPVFRDLFTRLAPHPTFGRLSLTHEIYRSRGTSMPTAYDDKEQRDINPAIGFSSAQSNVAALCYFLAFAFSGSDISFPFVILDDPLQSMDDINVLAFSDVCRFLRQEKQLIISTHDDRLAALLLRKLTPREDGVRTNSLKFESWDRSGPRIDMKRIDAEIVSPVFAPVRGEVERAARTNRHPL